MESLPANEGRVSRNDMEYAKPSFTMKKPLFLPREGIKRGERCTNHHQCGAWCLKFQSPNITNRSPETRARKVKEGEKRALN